MPDALRLPGLHMHQDVGLISEAHQAMLCRLFRQYQLSGLRLTQQILLTLVFYHHAPLST
ncbi:hypothetical protein GCM10011445_08520 [Pseudocitrobacter faecalis]|nr:hypothetical protein GCM10011445_08520 [Pseudocitrobacter faecalis]